MTRREHVEAHVLRIAVLLRAGALALVAALSRPAQQVWTPVAPDTIGGPHARPGPGPQPERPARGHPQPSRHGRHQRPGGAPDERRHPLPGRGQRRRVADHERDGRRARVDPAHRHAELAQHRPRRAAVRSRPTPPATRSSPAAGARAASRATAARASGCCGRRTAAPRWTVLTGGGTLTSKNATGVAARGATLLMSVNNNNGAVDINNIGIYRSTDTGATFTRVSGTGGAAAGPHLRPGGGSVEPRSRSTRACATRPRTASTSRTDTGATWARVSTPAMDTLRWKPRATSRSRSAPADNVYVGICTGIAAGHLPLGQRRRQLGVARPARPDHPPGRPGGHPPLVRRLAREPERGLHRRRPAEHAVPERRWRERLLGTAVPDRRLARARQPGAAPHALERAGRAGRRHRQQLRAARGLARDGDRRERRGDRGRRRRRLPADHSRQQHRHLASRSSATWSSTEFHGIAFDINTNTVFGGTQDNGTPAAGDAGQPGVVEHQHRGRRATWASTTSRPPASRCATPSFQILGQFRRRTYNSAGTSSSPRRLPTLTVTSGPGLRHAVLHAGQGQRARGRPR